MMKKDQVQVFLLLLLLLEQGNLQKKRTFSTS